MLQAVLSPARTPPPSVLEMLVQGKNQAEWVGWAQGVTPAAGPTAVDPGEQTGHS